MCWLIQKSIKMPINSYIAVKALPLQLESVCQIFYWIHSVHLEFPHTHKITSPLYSFVHNKTIGSSNVCQWCKKRAETLQTRVSEFFRWSYSNTKCQKRTLCDDMTFTPWHFICSISFNRNKKMTEYNSTLVSEYYIFTHPGDIFKE